MISNISLIERIMLEYFIFFSIIFSRNGFSETDKKKINTLYKCKGFEQTGGNGGGGGTEVTTEKPEKPDSKCRDTHK